MSADRAAPVRLDRRAFLLALPGVVGWASGQDVVQDTAAAGRLYDPSVVQSRPRVTDYDNDESIKSIEKQLRCTCGCNLDIYTCRTTDFTCATSPALHREIVGMWRDGKDAESILADFVSRHGEAILMAPPPAGFNLAGYLVPGIALLAVGTLLAIRLLRRRGEVAVREAGVPADADDVTPEELDRLARALREDGG